jgi:hypothetical protein
VEKDTGEYADGRRTSTGRGGASQCRKLHSFLPREIRIGCQISVLLWIITRIFLRDGALILKGTVNQVPFDANEVAFAWLNPVAFHAMHGLRFRPSIASFAARRSVGRGTETERRSREKLEDLAEPSKSPPHRDDTQVFSIFLISLGDVDLLDGTGCSLVFLYLDLVVLDSFRTCFWIWTTETDSL